MQLQPWLSAPNPAGVRGALPKISSSWFKRGRFVALSGGDREEGEER